MKKFKPILYAVIHFIRKHSEILTIPIALVLWWFSEPILRFIDPTAGTYDAGIFQVILFTIIQFLIYHGVAWLVFKFTFPIASNYLDNVFDKTILYQSVNPLTKWEKSKLVLFLFALYFLGIILLARVI
jgi:hypothetical protein